MLDLFGHNKCPMAFGDKDESRLHEASWKVYDTALHGLEEVKGENSDLQLGMSLFNFNIFIIHQLALALKLEIARFVSKRYIV